jgi:hypothetical protein
MDYLTISKGECVTLEPFIGLQAFQVIVQIDIIFDVIDVSFVYILIASLVQVHLEQSMHLAGRGNNVREVVALELRSPILWIIDVE